jgi:hypothetical protein
MGKTFLIWCSPIYQFLLLFPEQLASYSENNYLCLLSSRVFPIVVSVFQKWSYIKIFGPLRVDFYTGWEIGI